MSSPFCIKAPSMPLQNNLSVSERDGLSDGCGGWVERGVHTGHGMQFMAPKFGLVSFWCVWPSLFSTAMATAQIERKAIDMLRTDMQRGRGKDTERLSNLHKFWQMNAFIDVVFIHTQKFIIFLVCCCDPLCLALSSRPLALSLSLNALRQKSRRTVWHYCTGVVSWEELIHGDDYGSQSHKMLWCIKMTAVGNTKLNSG